MHTWLRAALAFISKQAHLLMTAHAVNTVQIKVQPTTKSLALLVLFRYVALKLDNIALIRSQLPQ